MIKVGDKILLDDDGPFIGTVTKITDSVLTPGEILLHGTSEWGYFSNLKLSNAKKYEEKEV